MPLIILIILAIIAYIVWRAYQALKRTAGLGRRQIKLPESRTVSASVTQFKRLTHDIDNGFKQNKRMPKAQEKALRAEIAQVQQHIIDLLWKMEHLAAVRTNAKDAANQFELMGMQRKLQAEIDRSLEMLERTSVALVRMDVLGNERSTDRLLADLSDTNQRLVATGDTYEEMRRVRRLSR